MNEKELRKKEIAQRMKNLRIASGLTQAQVADKLGITYQAVSNYERGKNSIEADVLFAMCDIYKVDPVSILQADSYLCPVCGLVYDPSLLSDVQEHDKYHRTFCGAVEYFGDCCIPRYKWSQIKDSAYNTLNSKDSTEEDKVNALLNLIKAYFSRSLSAWGYSKTHPKFDEYVSMLLNQNRFKEYKDAYHVLLSKYGKKPGIPEGETTYKIQDIINSIQGAQHNSKTKKKPSDLSEEAHQVAKDYDGLDRHGKNITKIVITEEQKRMVEERRKAETGEDGPKRTRIIPLYYTPAAAGMTSPAIGSDFDYIEIDADKAPWNADFAVRIDGDSMEPYIRDGSIVYVNREPLQNGDVGIFYIDGDMVCKQYYKDERGHTHLLSLNRNRSDADRFIHAQDTDTVMTYYGRVILPRRPMISMV